MTGHTPIENTYLEWITSRADLTSLDLRIILHIFRQTIGWGKEQDKISIGQFEKATNCCRSSIIDSIYRLEKNGFILTNRQGKGKINFYKLVGYTVTTSRVETTKTSRVDPTHKINKETKQKDFKLFIKDGRPIYQEQ